jgi:hypothetical protein
MCVPAKTQDMHRQICAARPLACVCWHWCALHAMRHKPSCTAASLPLCGLPCPPAFLNSSLKPSKVPKSRLMASRSLPMGAPAWCDSFSAQAYGQPPGSTAIVNHWLRSFCEVRVQPHEVQVHAERQAPGAAGHPAGGSEESKRGKGGPAAWSP